MIIEAGICVVFAYKSNLSMFFFNFRNLVATMQCLMFMLNPKDDIYIAFLPLAHVLELLSENTMMLFGIKVTILETGL